MANLEIKASARGSESGHWYNEGGLVSEVPSADGKRMIRPDCRHARKFGLVPSVTTILSVAARPGLDKWRREEFVKSAFHVWEERGLPKFEDEIDFEEIAARNEVRLDHAEIGTDIHAEIARAQECFELGIEPTPAPAARKAFKWLEEEFERLRQSYNRDDILSESEKPFANIPYRFGGTVDFKFIVPGEVVEFIDFKTCDDDKLAGGAKLAFWDSHLAQLVAYDMGTCIDPIDAERRYVNVFIGRFGGDIYVHEWKDEGQINKARGYFKACLELFKIVKGL